jgi:hypothetical protein
MSIKYSVLINFYGSCGETDLRFGVHFANNHIIIVELVEEMENIGSLSSYVKYSIVKYYLIICAHNHLAFIEHFKCDCPLTYLGVIFPSHQSPTSGAHTHAHAHTHPCPWVLGGHGCNIIVHGRAWAGMGGHGWGIIT